MKPILSYRMNDSESIEVLTLSIYDLLTPKKVNFKNHVLTLFLQRHTIHTTPISTFFNFFEFSQRILKEFLVPLGI